MSRARVKTTNLSIAVMVAFILTNLPYIVKEFFMQVIDRKICDSADRWCKVLNVSIQLDQYQVLKGGRGGIKYWDFPWTSNISNQGDYVLTST